MLASSASATETASKPSPHRRFESDLSDGLVQHNCHFPPNTLEALRLHAALTKSAGVSGLVRQVMEFYLAQTIDWNNDVRYAEVERVRVPKERYPGQLSKLGLDPS